MTKAEIVSQVADDIFVTRKEADLIVSTVLESIMDSLLIGDKVELRGFGSFRTRKRAARMGRNPKSGEPVEVPQKIIPFFRPGKQLREAVMDISPAVATEQTESAPPAEEPHEVDTDAAPNEE